jgi:hypothetical protein
MSLALDQEFETGVRLIRDAYSKKLSQREAEIVHLKGWLLLLIQVKRLERMPRLKN